jgi:RNA polymerase sigma-70 factor (ECF subfamily)
MLLHHARRRARLSPAGELVLLDAQDRTLWDAPQIAEGLALLDDALALRHPGPYQIQAAISALHAQAPTADATDWAQIAVLYGELQRFGYSPVVEVNRAVAVGMAYGPPAGLALIAALERDGALDDYHPFHVVRADLLARAGRIAEARGAYRTAIGLCRNDVERRTLQRRCDELEGAADGPVE